MMIRMRGDLHRDLDWSLGRIPSVAELILIDDQWYRITNVAWALVGKAEEMTGWDVGLVLMKTNTPPHLKPAEVDA